MILEQIMIIIKKNVSQLYGACQTDTFLFEQYVKNLPMWQTD